MASVAVQPADAAGDDDAGGGGFGGDGLGGAVATEAAESWRGLEAEGGSLLSMGQTAEVYWRRIEGRAGYRVSIVEE